MSQFSKKCYYTIEFHANFDGFVNKFERQQ